MKRSTAIIASCLAGVLALTLLLAGCATSAAPELNEGSGSAGGSGPDRYPPNASPEFDFTFDSDYGTASDTAPELARKVIYVYNYQLETTEMDATVAALESAIKTSGGYVESSNYSGRDKSDQYSYVTLTCRVPVSAVDGFQRAIEDAGHVTSKNEQGQDVTDAYFDTEAHLVVLQAQEERLLELLETSGDLSDLLEIERELARVRTEIEQLTGTLQKYDQLVDLATFNITVYNVSEYSPDIEETFGARLARSAQDSLRIALGVLQALVIMLVYMAPYLLFIGLVVFVILLVVRSRRRRKAKRQPQGFQTQGLPMPQQGVPQGGPVPGLQPPSGQPVEATGQPAESATMSYPQAGPDQGADDNKPE